MFATNDSKIDVVLASLFSLWSPRTLCLSSRYKNGLAELAPSSSKKMASKTLIRNGASLMNWILSKPLLHPNPNSNHQIVSHGLEITPKLFPSLSNFDTSFRLPQNDAESLKRVSSEGLVYPCGLPYLPFFLPDGTLSFSLFIGLCSFWIVRNVCIVFCSLLN